MFWVFRNPAANWMVVIGTLTDYREIHYEESLYPEWPAIKFRCPEVQYEFFYNGKKYVSNDVAFHKRDISIRSDLEQYPWMNWEVGSNIRVYVNPNNPSKSVLITEMGLERKRRYIQIFIGAYVAIGLFSYFLR